MSKKKIIIIGRGKWGKILRKKLVKVSFIAAQCGRNYKLARYENIDWVFIATPNNTHFKIINFLWKKKVNIFCEKPLLENSIKAQKLFDKFKKDSRKLYVSDLLYYIKNKIKFKKDNKIIRSKKANYSLKQILFQLSYHDFYFLYDHLKNTKILIKKIYKKNKLILEISNKKYKFKLIYDLKTTYKAHKYNNRDIVNNDDPLKTMLTKLLNNKVNFNLNEKRSMFANKLIDRVLNSKK